MLEHGVGLVSEVEGPGKSQVLQPKRKLRKMGKKLCERYFLH